MTKTEIRNTSQLAISNLQLAKYWQLTISYSNGQMVKWSMENEKLMKNDKCKMLNALNHRSIAKLSPIANRQLLIEATRGSA